MAITLAVFTVETLLLASSAKGVGVGIPQANRRLRTLRTEISIGDVGVFGGDVELTVTCAVWCGSREIPNAKLVTIAGWLVVELVFAAFVASAETRVPFALIPLRTESLVAGFAVTTAILVGGVPVTGDDRVAERLVSDQITELAADGSRNRVIPHAFLVCCAGSRNIVAEFATLNALSRRVPLALSLTKRAALTRGLQLAASLNASKTIAIPHASRISFAATPVIVGISAVADASVVNPLASGVTLTQILSFSRGVTDVVVSQTTVDALRTLSLPTALVISRASRFVIPTILAQVDAGTAVPLAHGGRDASLRSGDDGALSRALATISIPLATRVGIAVTIRFPILLASTLALRQRNKTPRALTLLVAAAITEALTNRRTLIVSAALAERRCDGAGLCHAAVPQALSEGCACCGGINAFAGEDAA